MVQKTTVNKFDRAVAVGSEKAGEILAMFKAAMTSESDYAVAYAA